MALSCFSSGLRQPRARARVACTIAATITALFGVSGTATATFPGSTGDVAWSDLSSQIHVGDPFDASDTPRDLGHGILPVWSPDGTRIVFGYDNDQTGTPVLAVVDLEGERVWSGRPGAAPTWSPDGTRIAVEVPYPEPMVPVLDAASGDVLWEVEGSQPGWTN